ncbi:MAG: hypothetical protein IPJ82_18860 [Lewinellaceae bacterium]|nr:hypothetical protein [Lewinellaceae bacterium]
MFLIITGAIAGIAFFMTAMAAFIGGVIWLMRKRDAQRRAELQQLATDFDLSYSEKDGYGLVAQLRHLDLFRYSGRRRWARNGKVYNVMRGHIGETEVFLFDYSYMVHTGKSSHEVRQTVFFANDKNWYLPNFKLKPETWWHKVMAKIGAMRDINFPESPDFSRKFWLTGELEELIRKQFGPDVQELLKERPPLHLEGNNYYLIAYKPGKQLNADETRVFFEHCSRLTTLLKTKKPVELLELADLKKEAPPEALEAPEMPEKKTG